MRGIIQRILARLSRHQLAVLTGVLLAVDLLVPDPIPFVDEIVLGLLTLVLSRRP
jgi:hypothetical protein